MYSENSRRPLKRANDEFLRRMVGGELTGNELPVMNMMPPEIGNRQMQGQASCNGSDTNAPGECPVTLAAPSLAMVYSPKQCWRNILDHDAALANGSLFAELVKPLEVGGNLRGTEVRTRK